VSEAAATTTGEVSLAEAGGGLGAAGRPRSPYSSVTVTAFIRRKQAQFSLIVHPIIFLPVVVVHFFPISYKKT
jgi:hypothetical protein